MTWGRSLCSGTLQNTLCSLGVLGRGEELEGELEGERRPLAAASTAAERGSNSSVHR